jgi:hypothetical protein
MGRCIGVNRQQGKKQQGSVQGDATGRKLHDKSRYVFR